MATNKGVSKRVQQDDDVSEEELDELQDYIHSLEKKAQQFEDLSSAASRGDHKLVFNKLGVSIKPLADKAQQPDAGRVPQPIQEQEQQEMFQKPQPQQQGDGSLETPQFTTDQWQKINAVMGRQNQVINALSQKLQQSELQIGIIKAEAEGQRLQNDLSRQVSSILNSEDGGFLKHRDPQAVTREVMARLESFRNTYGQDTTVDQVIKEMNNEYQDVFDKHVDEIPDEELEGYEEEGEEEDDGQQYPDEDEEVQLASEATEDGDEDKPKPRIIDLNDEDAMVKETDAAIDEVLARQEQSA